MYDLYSQAHHFHLKDIERQALRCRESGRRGSALKARTIAATFAVTCIAVAFIGLAGQF